MATDLSLTATGGIGSGDALETNVTTLTAANNPAWGATVDGGIGIVNAGALTVLAATQADVFDEGVNSGDITITTLAGDLLIAGAVTARDGGVITLAAGGAGSDVVIGGPVSSTVGLKDLGGGVVVTGDVNVTAPGDVWFINDGAGHDGSIVMTQDILSATNGTVDTQLVGTLTVIAGTGNIVEANANNDGTAEIRAGAVVLTAGAGMIAQENGTDAIEIDTNRSVTATALNTVNLYETAGIMNVNLIQSTTNAAVTLTSAGGIESVTPGGAADIIGGNVTLTVLGGGIGAAGAIDLESGQVTATTAGGNIGLNEVTGDLNVALVNAGAGNVTLAADADIQEAGNDPDIDIAGATISLTAGTGGVSGNIGTDLPGGAIEMDATTALNADASGLNGTFNLADTAGNLAIGYIDAGAAGSVTLSSTGTMLDDVNDAAAPALDILANTLNLTAVTGIGAGLPLELGGVDTLTAVTGTGAISLSNTADGAVTLTDVHTGNGDIAYTQTGPFAVYVTNVAGNTINNTVVLNAAGAIDNSVGTGDNTANITGATINLTSTAGAIGGVNGALDVDATTALSASTPHANIAIDDVVGDMPVAAILAGTGTVTLTADADIQEAGNDTDIDIAGTTISLTAGTGGVSGNIGTDAPGGALEIDAVTALNADSSGLNGTFDLADVAGNLPIGFINAGAAGSVTLSSVGTMLDDVDDAAAPALDIAAQTLNLTAVNGIGVDRPLELGVADITAHTTGNMADVVLANDFAGAATLNVLVNGDRSDISFSQTGGGSLTLASVIANAGDVAVAADGAVDAVQVYALDKGRINGLVDDASQVDITGTVVTVTDVRADYDANITATTGNVNLHADAIHAGNTINMYAGDSVQDIDNNGTINAVAIAGPINITVGTGVIGVPGNPVELNAGQGLTLTSLDPAGVGPFWAVVDGTFGGPVDYAGVGNTPPGVIFVNGNTFGGPSDLLNAIALAQNPAIGATPLTFGALMGALVPSDSVSLLNTFFLHATVVLNEFRTMPMNQYFAFGSGWVDGLPSGIGPAYVRLPLAVDRPFSWGETVNEKVDPRKKAPKGSDAK